MGVLLTMPILHRSNRLACEPAALRGLGQSLPREHKVCAGQIALNGAHARAIGHARWCGAGPIAARLADPAAARLPGARAAAAGDHGHHPGARRHPGRSRRLYAPEPGYGPARWRLLVRFALLADQSARRSRPALDAT